MIIAFNYCSIFRRERRPERVSAYVCREQKIDLLTRAFSSWVGLTTSSHVVVYVIKNQFTLSLLMSMNRGSTKLGFSFSPTFAAWLPVTPPKLLKVGQKSMQMAMKRSLRPSAIDSFSCESRDAVYCLRPMVLALPYSPKERSESSNMYYSD